jgi:NAD(P)-dependent dehydrogenase (short-subunit alcohol dehydrogenase family)
MAGEMATKFGENFRVMPCAGVFYYRTKSHAPHKSRWILFRSRKNIIAHTPFRRFGVPEDLLGTLHYLVSDASKFVTGTVAVVDGGFDAFSI